MQSGKQLVSRFARKVFSPFVPPRNQLSFRYRLHAFGGSCENELRNLERIVGETKVALDIGANEGLYAYRMSRIFETVHAFELNDELTRELAAFNPGNITIHPEGLSSRESQATLYIPVHHGVPLPGWASLAPGNCPETREHIEKPVQIRPLDSFGIEHVSFIKIDVEGHELEVLKGGRETLARDRPIVLCEVRDRNRADVRSLFSELNYRETTLQEQIGIAGSEGNFLFFPEDRPPSSA